MSQAVLEQDTTSMYEVGKQHAALQKRLGWSLIPYPQNDPTFSNRTDPAEAHSQYLKGYSGEPE